MTPSLISTLCHEKRDLRGAGYSFSVLPGGKADPKSTSSLKHGDRSTEPQPWSQLYQLCNRGSKYTLLLQATKKRVWFLCSITTAKTD